MSHLEKKFHSHLTVVFISSFAIIFFNMSDLFETMTFEKFFISLTSFADEQFFETLKELVLRVNEHAASRDYAIVLARIKKFKHDEKRKT